MNKVYYLQNRNSSGLILLEGAIISSIVTILFVAILGFTEHLNLINVSNQILKQELGQQVLSGSSFTNNSLKHNRQVLLLEKLSRNIQEKLDQHGVKNDEFSLITALSKVDSKDKTSSAELTSKYLTGNRSLDLDNNFESMALAAFQSSGSSATYKNDYQTKFLSLKDNTLSTSTFFILGRLVIKPQGGIFKILKAINRDSSIKVEAVLPFKLQYQL